ncbi:MAG TPA: hypothetical protein VHH36_09825 [Candidatus Thermoplasmatota archaeon]|nr:hypothetical protein [Candidatus Thermoplasmatota archaeon]
MTRKQHPLARRLAPIGIALALLLGIAGTAGAYGGFMPGSSHGDDRCTDHSTLNSGVGHVCAGSATKGDVECTGVWHRSPTVGRQYSEKFVGVCRDVTDPTNVGVCTAEEENYQPPQNGDTYSWEYACTGYWNGCTAWSQSESGYYYSSTGKTAWSQSSGSGWLPGFPQPDCPNKDWT